MPSSTSELIEEDLIAWDCPVEKAICREDLDNVLAAMGGLAAANRELIALRYIHGWSSLQDPCELSFGPNLQCQRRDDLEARVADRRADKQAAG